MGRELFLIQKGYIDMKALILSVFTLCFISCDAQEKTSTPKMETNMEGKVALSESEWKEKLSPEEYRILRESGTERPFSGKFYDHHESGMYTCAACGNPLFSSETKYESGSGWPSFYDAIDKTKIKEIRDTSSGMTRVEVRCARCDGHLGHVFEDGPRDKTGLRYCVNSASLDFEKK